MAPHALPAEDAQEATTTSTIPTTPATTKKASPALLHRLINAPPPTAISAHGSTLTLSTGATILDACGGAAVSILGHGHPEIIAAGCAQLSTLPYCHTGAYTTDAAESLAAILIEDGKRFGLAKALFVGSGSEAMDAAMKLARQFWYEVGDEGVRERKTRWVARKQGYHGVTLGAMGLSSNLPRKVPYAPLQIPGVSFVGPAYAYQYQRAGEDEEGYVARLRGELEEEFERLGGGKEVIAFVGEPVVGATSGCTPAPRGYWKMVREVCDAFDVLLILDEVMCGCGRTGTFFAFEQEGIVPDIVTLGKGLGAGYAPIAGVLISERVLQGLMMGAGSFNHFQTYQLHPLTCAIALEVQKVLRRNRLVERCNEMGKLLENDLYGALAEAKYVGNIRGRGLLWGIEFVKDKSTKEPFDPKVEIGARVQKKAFEMGVAIYPGVATIDGIKGDHVLLAPPYTITKEELRQAVDVTRMAVLAIESEIDGDKPK
ncbi:MAG: hypothetical protein OHK93_006991 [Ramalina farinacea]|uniref:Aminotransferase n=1 Tax=Ramalina farinacea TaxID=258253 RepID=A0AA43QLB7_9LECA|nr:hypothetical protein [Ramalina farinacea]